MSQLGIMSKVLFDEICNDSYRHLTEVSIQFSRLLHIEVINVAPLQDK